MIDVVTEVIIDDIGVDMTGFRVWVALINGGLGVGDVGSIVGT